ncbi:DUF2970 domain-containing protein [Gammaproteobacteria bacterium]|nr:DUF2970 domain-containing protein [Gammaproteobacteria bacterium]
MEDNDQESEKKLPLIDVALSICAAALGVQSSKNRKRDFSKGNPITFLFFGALFTVIFVLAIVGIVHLVI